MTGKIIVTGTKSEPECMQAAHKFVKILEKLGYPVGVADFARYQFKVQNMTATCDFGFPVGLEAMVFAHSAFCTYEPELFPGILTRTHTMDVTYYTPLSF